MKSEGVELSNDELEQISGGGAEWLVGVKCPRCGRYGEIGTFVIDYGSYYYCDRCGHHWYK